MAHLDEIIAVNSAAAGKLGDATRLSQDARRELCLLTCVDPRLVRFFSLALGIERGDAVIIRLPGASVLTGHGDGLRAVAAAVYINHASEFLVLGHTDCGTTKIDASAITSTMQKRGVAADSMPGGVREFLGGSADARQAVKATAAAIRSAAFLPRDLLVHAAMIDIQTGALEIVERGENFVAVAGAESPDTLGYRPGPSGDLGSSLGDGASLLRAGPVSGASALAGSADPFFTLASDLPPGWSDGSAALASVAMPLTSGSDIVAGFQAATVMSMPTQMLSPNMPGLAAAGANDMIGGMTASVAAHGQKAPPPTPSKKAPARAAKPSRAGKPSSHKAAAAEPDENLAKVRDFMRLEFTPEQRREGAKALARAAREGHTGANLAKLVIKPILDTGQKRYRVVDEVIALKEQASGLDPDAALALLAQLYD
jgi:carbonic anhydrase